jgi:hypothetical protein
MKKTEPDDEGDFLAESLFNAMRRDVASTSPAVRKVWTVTFETRRRPLKDYQGEFRRGWRRMNKDSRAGWRRTIVEPRLAALGWSVYRWEKEAGVPSKLAQRYLDGKTVKLEADSRKKLSGALGIDLPL